MKQKTEIEIIIDSWNQRAAEFSNKGLAVPPNILEKIQVANAYLRAIKAIEYVRSCHLTNQVKADMRKILEGK